MDDPNQTQDPTQAPMPAPADPGMGDSGAQAPAADPGIGMPATDPGIGGGEEAPVMPETPAMPEAPAEAPAMPEETPAPEAGGDQADIGGSDPNAGGAPVA